MVCVAGRAPSGHARRIDAYTDIARFRENDPDPLVIASLACPVCLRSEPVRSGAALAGYDPSVRCRCSECRVHWQVYLTDQQALRLGLMAAAAQRS